MANKVGAPPANQFKKGQVANPAGRPKGARNKETVMLETAAAMAKRFKITPLEYMLMVINNEKASMTLRLDAAKAAAPYMHKKMPTELNLGAGASDPVGEALESARDALTTKLKATRAKSGG